MGLGGNIMWTPIVRKLSAKFNKKVYLVRGLNPVWINNPYITTSPIGSFPLDTQSPRTLYSDPEKITVDKEAWKTDEINTHVIVWLTTQFNLEQEPVIKGEVYPTDEERNKVTTLCSNLSKDFITIDPYAYKGWSPNREVITPDKFQNVINKLHKDIQVVQISDPRLPVLNNATLLSLSFREAWVALEKSRLFIGSEGGMAHAATAVGTKCVLVFNSQSPMRFLAYPQNININVGRHPVCGLRQYCPDCEKDRIEFNEERILWYALKELENKDII